MPSSVTRLRKIPRSLAKYSRYLLIDCSRNFSAVLRFSSRTGNHTLLGSGLLFRKHFSPAAVVARTPASVMHLLLCLVALVALVDAQWSVDSLLLNLTVCSVPGRTRRMVTSSTSHLLTPVRAPAITADIYLTYAASDYQTAPNSRASSAFDD